MSKSEQSLQFVQEGKLDVNDGIRVCQKRGLFYLTSNQRRKMEKVAPLPFFCSVDEAETLEDKSDLVQKKTSVDDQRLFTRK